MAAGSCDRVKMAAKLLHLPVVKMATRNQKGSWASMKLVGAKMAAGFCSLLMAKMATGSRVGERQDGHRETKWLPSFCISQSRWPPGFGVKMAAGSRDGQSQDGCREAGSKGSQDGHQITP